MRPLKVRFVGICVFHALLGSHLKLPTCDELQTKRDKLSETPAAVMIDLHGAKIGSLILEDDIPPQSDTTSTFVTTRALRASDPKEKKPEQVIPFRLTNWNNISVPVTINNTIALNLMFHTAVDSVSLTQATTERFPEITLDQEGDLKSWGGQSKTRFGTGHFLKIAELAPQQVTIFEDLHSGHGTDGKLGPAQLSSRFLAIDFDQSEIRLLSDLPTNVSGWQKVSFETEQGMIFISGTVHGEDKSASHKFMIHSGYSGFALLDDAFAAKHPFLANLEIIDKSELTDSAGNKLETTKAKLSKFTVGESVFEDAPVSFFSGAIGQQKFSLLGGDFLKRFNYVFDFDTHNLYMTQNSLTKTTYFPVD